MDGREVFLRNLIAHAEVLKLMDTVAEEVALSARIIAEALAAGGRVLFCGNGGSAADAQHLAAELSGRYLKDRRPLDGIALTCNTSALTAIGNDYGFDEILARQVEAHGRKGDALVAISTSGNSANVLKAAERARAMGLRVIGMTGEEGGKMRELCDVLIAVPSRSTPRIQEMHALAGHAICDIAEGVLCR